MTDSEIIKVLECCSKTVGESCINCPLNESNCLEGNIEYLALDLINRQKAEIERLETENKDLPEQFHYLDIECERLEKENENQKAELEKVKSVYNSFEAELECAKAEAIKEFAERLEQHFGKLDIFCGDELVTFIYSMDKREFDNLVKEMVGE